MSASFKRLRVFSALLAAAVAMAPVVASLHSDDHAHVYCAQHQAIEESDGTTSDTSRSTDSWTSANDEVSSHESCPFLALTTRASELNHAASSVPLLEADAVAARLEFSAGHEVVALLLEAPKSSPPQA